MRYWDELATYERDGFTVIVDKTWEDSHPGDLFDTSIDPDTGKPYFDIEQMCQDIDDDKLDWFVLRARAMVRGFELGNHIVGGFLYEDAREVLTDGTAEDLIWSAVSEAKGAVKELADEFARLAMTVDEETAAN
jgi:hypothetical protein